MTMNLKINWDALGITASLACAIHCAILPLFLTSLPLFGIQVINNRWFEGFMIVLAFCIGANALYHGYGKHHHSKFPVSIFFMGFVFLIAKQIWHPWQLWFLLPAVVLIVSAHYMNFRLCRKAAQCHVDDCRH